MTDWLTDQSTTHSPHTQLREVYDQIRNGAADSIDELVAAFELVDSTSPQYTTEFLAELVRRMLNVNPQLSLSTKGRILERVRRHSTTSQQQH